MALGDILSALRNVSVFSTKSTSFNTFHADDRFNTIEHGVKDIRPNEPTFINEYRSIPTSSHNLMIGSNLRQVMTKTESSISIQMWRQLNCYQIGQSMINYNQGNSMEILTSSLFSPNSMTALFDSTLQRIFMSRPTVKILLTRWIPSTVNPVVC